ncbi:MAG: MFS transporter [Clostridia bacterium]|nr:MFS transporter [Clostridia bacterium]
MAKSGGVPSAFIEVSERLWNSDFIRIFIIATLCNISQQMIGSTLPYYVIVLGGSPSQAGVMTGLLTLAALCSRPFVGRICDTKGRRVVTVFGIFVFLSGTLVYILSMNVYLVMAFRVLQGVGIACVSTANGTIAADVLPEKRLSAGIAYFGLTATAATSVGPALALSLMTGGVYSPMFAVSGLAMIAALVIIMTLNYEKKARERFEEYKKEHPEEFEITGAESGGESEEKVPLIWRIFEKTVFRPSLVVLLLAMSMSCVLSFMPSFAISLGIENPGMFYTATAVVILIVRVLTSRLFGRVHTLVIMIPSLAIFSAALFSLSQLNSFTHLIICSVIYGIGVGAALPTTNALVVKHAPIDRRGSANATYYASFDIGIGAGAALWGFIIDYLGGYRVAFISAGVCCIIAIVLSAFVLRDLKL